MKFLDEYDYQLPPELIAHEPATPRDRARLFVYDTRTDAVAFARVADVPQYVGGACLVHNDTKVLPARLAGVGAGEKPVELLVLMDQGFREDDQTVRVLVNRYTPVGEHITVSDAHFTVLENKEKSMVMQFSGSEAELRALLEVSGQTPLPPYIESVASEASRRQQYQTVFAKEAPSVAAPTASLHFTDKLITALEATGATFTPVTLQVGLGTFAPIFPEHFAAKALHQEFFSVPRVSAEVIAAAKASGRPVVAIGTTVVRALESGKDAVLSGGGVVGVTDLFIFPPYQFSVPDVLMTNFHVPRSSLMCMVEAFLEHKGAKRTLRELYELAITERFRFYSFGDAMLIL